MTDHSIAQLKRQMDEARSRKDVAMNVYLLAARAYEKACIAKAEEDAKAAGFIPGKTLVEWDNWRLDPVRGLYLGVSGAHRGYAEISKLKKNGAPGKRADIQHMSLLRIVGEYAA